MSNVEQRNFRIANNMMHHLFFAQAGTIAKALAELVMNSQDAKANLFELTIDNDGFTASDNGRGFQTRKEIEDWFEELGFVHDSELHQEEDRFSRFGMGRCQIMAFSSTSWLTNEFRMDVDTKEHGFGYELYSNQEAVKGLTVQGKWYQSMSFTELKTVLTEFEELVGYARIDIQVNGKLINKRNTKWDYETDQVFVKRRETGDLMVFNQGILIRKYPSYEFGSGVVVSKVSFTLNMARNDILQAKCKVWKEVKAFLREEATERSKKKPRLNDGERQLLINQLIEGEAEYHELHNTQLLEDVTGRKHRLSRITEGAITVHTSGAKLLADRVHQSKIAFVLSKKMLEMFSVDSAEELVERLNTILSTVHHGLTKVNFTPIEDLLDAQSDEHVLLTQKELTKTEKVALKSLNYGMRLLADAVYRVTNIDYRDRKYRKLYIGKSDNAAAWTDGQTFVAIERNLVKENIRDGLRGFTALANVLVHELCHDCNTATDHDHNAEFYETFHDVMINSRDYSYGTALRQMMADFLRRAPKEGLKLSRNELRDLDREVAIEREVYDDNSFQLEVTEGAAA